MAPPTSNPNAQRTPEMTDASVRALLVNNKVPSIDTALSQVQSNQMSDLIEKLLPQSLISVHDLDFTYYLTIPNAEPSLETSSSGSCHAVPVHRKTDMSVEMRTWLLKETFTRKLWVKPLTNTAIQPVFDLLGLSKFDVADWKITRVAAHKDVIHEKVLGAVCDAVIIEARRKLYAFLSKSITDMKKNNHIVVFESGSDRGTKEWAAQFNLDDINDGKISLKKTQVTMPGVIDQRLRTHLGELTEDMKVKLLEILFETVHGMSIDTKQSLMTKLLDAATVHKIPDTLPHIKAESDKRTNICTQNLRRLKAKELNCHYSDPRIVGWQPPPMQLFPHTGGKSPEQLWLDEQEEKLRSSQQEVLRHTESEIQRVAQERGIVQLAMSNFYDDRQFRERTPLPTYSPHARTSYTNSHQYVNNDGMRPVFRKHTTPLDDFYTASDRSQHDDMEPQLQNDLPFHRNGDGLNASADEEDENDEYERSPLDENIDPELRTPDGQPNLDPVHEAATPTPSIVGLAENAIRVTNSRKRAATPERGLPERHSQRRKGGYVDAGDLYNQGERSPIQSETEDLAPEPLQPRPTRKSRRTGGRK